MDCVVLLEITDLNDFDLSKVFFIMVDAVPSYEPFAW